MLSSDSLAFSKLWSGSSSAESPAGKASKDEDISAMIVTLAHYKRHQGWIPVRLLATMERAIQRKILELSFPPPICWTYLKLAWPVGLRDQRFYHTPFLSQPQPPDNKYPAIREEHYSSRHGSQNEHENNFSLSTSTTVSPCCTTRRAPCATL